MAVSFRTATQNSSSTGSDLSVAAPTGTTIGDLVKVIAHANGQTTIADNNYKTIVAANLAASSVTTPGTSFVTPSVSVTSGKTYLFGFSIRNGASTNPSLPTVTGAGITWTSVGSTAIYDDSGTSRRTLFLFSGTCSSTTSGALTVDFGAVSHTGMIYTIDELSYADTSGTIVQSASNKDTTGTVSTLSVTLAAFAKASNATYAVFCNGNDSATTTPGTGFSKLGDFSESNSNVSGRLTSEFRSGNDTSADITYSLTAQLGGIAVEIKSATAAFTEQIDDYQPNTSNGHTMSIFSRVIEAGDPSTYNFVSGASGRWGIIAICATDSTTPADDYAPNTGVGASNRDSSGDGDATTESITTIADNAINIITAGWDTGAIGTITTPAGYTLLANANGGGEPLHASYKVITPPGATGTQVINNTEFGAYIAFSFSIKSTATPSTSLKDMVGIGILPFAR